MKILQLRPRLEIGGADQSLLTLSEGLQCAGHQVSIATQGGQRFADVQRLGVPLYQLPFYPTSVQNLIHSVSLLRQVIKKENFDLLHSHHRFTNLVCKLAASLTGIPTVSTVHEIKTNRSLLTRIGMGQQIIVYSQAVQQHLVSVVGVQPDKISVVPVGIYQNVSTDVQIMEARKLIRIDNSQPAFACIARLSEEKGLDILLQAVSLLKQDGGHFQCYIVGDGLQSESLRNLSNKLEISELVHFLGWQENVAGIIANVDFLVLPSRSEGLGLVILEGLLQAKPTVATNVGGIPEVIKNEKTGMLIPPNDPVELAKAIRKMLNQPKWRQLLGQVGQQMVIRDFSVAQMVAETEAVYRQVCRTS